MLESFCSLYCLHFVSISFVLRLNSSSLEFRLIPNKPRSFGSHPPKKIGVVGNLEFLRPAQPLLSLSLLQTHQDSTPVPRPSRLYLLLLLLPHPTLVYLVTEYKSEDIFPPSPGPTYSRYYDPPPSCDHVQPVDIALP